MAINIPAAESLTKAERAYIMVLYRDCYDKLYRVAYRHLSNICVDSIEDVIQETFRRACESFKQMTAFDSAEAWLVGTCHHIALDEVNRYTQLSELHEGDYRQEDINLDRLEQILPVTMQEKDRRILHLFYVEKNSSDEIAKIMNMSAPAVRQKLSRLRAELKKKIKL